MLMHIYANTHTCIYIYIKSVHELCNYDLEDQLFVNRKDMFVVVCADLSGKELHRQVSVGIMVTSGSLHDVMVAH